MGAKFVCFRTYWWLLRTQKLKVGFHKLQGICVDLQGNYSQTIGLL